MSIYTSQILLKLNQNNNRRGISVRCRRAERSYSMFKVRRGDLVQGKEQRLGFAGAAVKTYPTSKVREIQVRWTSEGRHTER